MSIFRRKRKSTSNDYYNSYKAELGITEKSDGFFSLSTIVKIETVTIIAGVIFMGYSDFFSDFSKNFSIEFHPNALMSQSLLPTSNNFDISISKSEPIIVTPLEITEERKVMEEPVKVLAKKLDMNFADLSLIVEIIKSEMSTKALSPNEDTIIIGQL